MTKTRLAYITKYKETHKEHLRNYRRSYLDKNRERIMAYRKEYKRRYKILYPEKHHNSTKNRALKNLFGIDLLQYKLLLEKQNYCCLICGMTQKENGKDLAVDHSPITGKIRGLLCKNCNVGLGYFKDQPTLIRKAADYLENI
jgi:hypothetical protein